MNVTNNVFFHVGKMQNFLETIIFMLAKYNTVLQNLPMFLYNLAGVLVQ